MILVLVSGLYVILFLAPILIRRIVFGLRVYSVGLLFVYKQLCHQKGWASMRLNRVIREAEVAAALKVRRQCQVQVKHEGYKRRLDTCCHGWKPHIIPNIDQAWLKSTHVKDVGIAIRHL